MTLNNSTLTNNAVTVDGGGLANLATATVSNSLVIANSANNAGGGIYNTATLTVTGGSRITTNHVIGLGGGIYSISGQVTFVQITLDGNLCDFIGGGFLNDTQDHATIWQCTITNNQAACAGGLYNFSTMTVGSTLVLGNTATLTGGGGVYNDVDSQLTIFTSTLAGNTATESGGGLVNYGSLQAAENTFRRQHRPDRGQSCHRIRRGDAR